MKIVSIDCQLTKAERLQNVDHPNKMQIKTLERSGYDQYWIEPNGVREMAASAAKKAISKLNIHTKDIDFIIAGQSGVPDYIGIDLACQVGAELNCKSVRTMNLVEGCASGISAWMHASSFAKSLPVNKVGLIVLSQRISDSHQDRFGLMNAILSDGAAVAVVAGDSWSLDGPSLRYLAAEDISDCRYVDMMRVEHGGGKQPYVSETLDPRKDKLGRERIMDIYRFDADALTEFLKLRSDNNIDIIRRVISEVGRELNRPFLIQTLEGKQSIKSLCNELGIPTDRSNLDLLPKLGHIGCVDLLISLKILVEEDKIKPGDDIVMSTISTGLKWGAAVFEYDES
ncbi:hypothetical protein MHO82_24870 [Vibrio sp. Of7-15]|uniref:3-oxoacyl-[acyl-carrier-protein] synthase III C-terminal domain-containing protein n=1 Tax=Vibrio sp. Of7-15 TaxID=2724879 RepID=UPI001EF3C0B5|nr:3-oxoacyl-[acyl-carrier-protein] synthase III C-terminal domain-containing protein [Vibrio sp. Of7-15]MCG7500101.1 hypothetical protein [Vibrio sp. Of7-15]